MMRLVLAAAAALCAAGASAQVDRDWRAVTEKDAQALHDAFVDSHPGVVDPQNPGFKAALTSGLAKARERAKTAGSYGAYWWAMREYVAGFNDGHVAMGETPASLKTPSSWPGFLTRDTAEGQLVAVSAGSPSAPPVGARLVACDGVPAARLAEENVGRFRGRWDLESQRAAHGWRLFLDAGNPYIRRPVRCEFEQAGERRSYDLIWAPLPQAEFEAHAKAVAATYRAPVEVRRFANNALWVSAGTFTSDAASEAGKQLEALVGTLNDPATVRDAEVIVLDVRGNGGGSSRWGDRIAAAIWGQKNAEAAKPKSAGVDWRASEANIAALQAFKDSPGSGLGLRVWADHAIKGMKKAKAAGQVYWRETSPVGRLFGGGGSKAARIDPATFNTRAKVYVLADAACASACLDALDVWRALGAVQVGRETSADSLYMEIRQQTLPSGFASLSIPMKVYRGRPRGANEPYRPAHQLDERMSDTAALERRILALAETGG